MKLQIEDFKIKDIIRSTTFAGWLLLAYPVLSTFFSRQRGLSAYATVDATAMIFIIYSVFASYVGYRTIIYEKSAFGADIIFRSPITWFLIYSLLGIVSMVWSVNPALSGYRAFECIAMAFLITSVIQQLFERGDLKYVILWSVFFCTWNVFWGIIKTLQWTSDIGTILESSQMMATTFFFMALYLIPWKWYNYLIMIMSICSMSTVSYIGMGLGCISAYWNHGKAKFISVIAGFLLLIATILVGPYVLLKNTIFFDKEDISIENTSGRDHLMEATIDCVKHHPYGLGFFAAEPYILYTKHLGAISAHNSLFSAGMGMGIPGILLFSIFLILMAKCAFSKKIEDEFRPIIIGCFCVAFMQCMGNPSVGTRVYAAWIPCMYIFVLTSAFYVYGRGYKVENETIEETNLMK